MLAVDEPQNRARLDRADPCGRDPPPGEAVEHRRGPVGTDAQHETETREARKPPQQVGALGPRHLCRVDRAADARAFEQHRGGTDRARHRDVLAGAAELGLGDFGEQCEVGAQPRGRCARAGIPIGRGRGAVGAAQIDRHHEIVARHRIEARDQARRPPEYRHREAAARRARVGVAADDRNAVARRRLLQALEHGPGGRVVRGPERVDHRGRAAAHGRDIAEVDHHAAIAGEPGLGRHEGVDEAFDREKRVAVAVRDRGAVVADRNRRRFEAERRDRTRDIALAV